MAYPKMRQERRDFAKIPTIIDIPDLIDIQKSSYERFLQEDVPPPERKNIGLQAAFNSIFPIADFNETFTIEFVEYSIGEQKFSVRECLQRGTTYAAPLKIKVRLAAWEKDEETGTRRLKYAKEEGADIYLGELPLMTENGTFIINGTERVVVSQLHRSPGAFFTHDKGKTHSSGKVLYSARIIPYRGSWLDFEFDVKDLLYVRIDRRRKLPATVLLKALGYSNEELLRTYYPVEEIKIKKNGFTRKVNPEILVGLKAAFDISAEKGKDKEVIVKKGNKITKGALKKLKDAGIDEIPITVEELVGRVAVSDIFDPQTGEVIVEGNETMTTDSIVKLQKANLGEGEPGAQFLFIDGIRFIPSLRETLMLDKLASPEEAMVEIYRRLRPGEPPTLDMARSLFDNMFFNDKRYDLSPVGRLKMNKKLGLDVDIENRVLTKEDIIEVIRYLIDLKTGKGEVDDIDHLGNRRVRSVGELLENQFRIGLVRMERTIKERMSLQDLENIMPHDLINAKPVTAAIKEFFGSSQLSQFMDQTNPLAEITHKRRLSALGPGGLTRERAGFEVRDVHPTHYGRICPIETPEGPNIGLITSLATYARVNEFGFIEAPYRKVTKGRAMTDIDYLSAVEGEHFVIAQANTPMDEKGVITIDSTSAREGGEFRMVSPEEIEYMDVSPKQIVSVATALIPFLENDDANRALMGSNMQRQAVPLLRCDAPVVGTGMEKVAARDSGVIVLAKRGGTVESVDANRIVVRANEKEINAENPSPLDVYTLIKFYRSNQNTCINQKPLVSAGQKVRRFQVLADGPATDGGELALGQNILVAFMPWGGYNYEDAILISEKLVREDRYTSIHIEEFEIESRDTKLGQEEITRDIPNVGDEALKDLDESGIIRIGAEVKAGDILVGKVTPKGETQLTPEERLLRAIFGEKAGDVRDASLTVPPGVEGTVVDVKIFSRKGVEKDDRAKSIEDEEIDRLDRDKQEEVRIIQEEKVKKMKKAVLGRTSAVKLVDADGKTVLAKGKPVTEELLDMLSGDEIASLSFEEEEVLDRLDEIEEHALDQMGSLDALFNERVARLRKGDELPPGVIKLVKVYIAMKRKLSVGDKMAGRHGNKGVVSRIVAEEELPFMPDGRPVEVVLNPLGVPSRMNVGQILETHLGWAAKTLGINVATPVFDGATEAQIKDMLEEAGLPRTGQVTLRDGRTGEEFDRKVTVGYMYMLKLHHLVDDKLHARSIGPYSLVTQQPLGGKAQFGGQRLGEMEVWALQAYGAAYCLQEFLTVKSDDVTGRAKIYEAIVKGESTLEPGLPESFNVLIKELQSLCLDVELLEDVEA
ncbi:MAG: DNA-directed RNA polymerase subunit beta [Nitrospirae bacterium]|nr:DNA-directed RNA polymerase subunit beta [Nitrospirota bacterium]MBI5695743.1 DNA-directed RNA polymerase subunit beta [Nitrospirota bacterium]